MAEDDADAPMSADEVIASAQRIVDQLRERWRNSGLPASVLAHQMIGAGITDLANERGIGAALELLRELVSDIETAVAWRTTQKPRRRNLHHVTSCRGRPSRLRQLRRGAELRHSGQRWLHYRCPGRPIRRGVIQKMETLLS
jgi:hypothetical protein